MLKPYSLQAPEQIAKEYGGDKQKIQEAARFQLIDPTAAVLAGMFIDRVRAAEAAEMQHAQTVAQDVFGPKTPPAAVAGLQNAPLQPQPQQEAPLPAGIQLAQPTGVGNLPIPESMVPEVDMGQGKAGGGLVAFAGGGSVPGYADGVLVQDNIKDIGARALAERQAARQALVGGSTTRDEFLRGYVPPTTSYDDILKGAQNRVSIGLPQLDYTGYADYYGPEMLGGRKAAAEKLMQDRYTRGLKTAALVGGFGGAGDIKGTTGSVVGDILQGGIAFGKQFAPAYLEAEKAKMAAEDKIIGMEEAAQDKRFNILNQERTAALQEKQIAIATADKQAERDADERIKYYTAQMNLLVARAQASKTGPSQYTSAFNTRLEQLRQEAIAAGINPDDPAVKARLENQASTEVRLEEAAVKVASTMTLEQVKELNANLTKARESITKEWQDVKDRLYSVDLKYATAKSEENTDPDSAAYVKKVETEAMNELRNKTFETFGINPIIAATRAEGELNKLNSIIGGLLSGVRKASEKPTEKSDAETSGGEAFKVGDKSYKVGDRINDAQHGLIEFGGLDENGQPLWYKVEQ